MIVPSTETQIKTSKWQVIKEISRGQTKLMDLINELQKSTLDEENIQVEETNNSRINPPKSIEIFRQRLANLVQKRNFHYLIIIFVIFDLVIILIDLVLAQLSLPCLTEQEMKEYNTTQQRELCILEHTIHVHRTEIFLFYFSFLFICIFVLEIFVSIYALRWKYFKNRLYLLDGIVVIASFVLEIVFHYGNLGNARRAASTIIILRLWKIIRAVHAVAHSLTLKNRLLIEKIEEAKGILEEERTQIEQTLEKQNLKLNYYVHLLNNSGKLPTQEQIDKYVNEISKKKV